MRTWLVPLGVVVCLAACGPAGTKHASVATTAASQDPCGARGVAVQVLGSGGPIGDDARASTGYVLWVDGRARAIVDMGGGTFQRAATVEVQVPDLHAVLLTHYHVDHTADLPALLKRASFGDRSRALPVVGPSGDDAFPSLGEFLEALIGSELGAWRYLGGMLDEGQPFVLAPREVDVEAEAPTDVATHDDLQVTAVGVPHGVVPALGYAIEVQGVRVVFTGDQRMDEDRFRGMARDADLLVAHAAIPEGATPPMSTLHARPSQIGHLAAEADAGALVLSHHMRRSLAKRDEVRHAIREHFDGPLRWASDLDCLPLQ